ncbi:DUF2971 domain-containing protein [Streptomyces luteogriseus]|uniref:DUF2971 domain-containing protein n=1 Tax=Streptomyces luteogriseus TaxID=68233 RepID=UPI003FA3CD78
MTSSESSASNRGFSLSRAALDALDALELEVAGAQRSETNDLYHYTNANVAMYNILASGTLRLSPFESTNDLWESRPLHPNLSSHHDDENWPEGSGHMDLWADIDRNIRLHAKVVCLTRDFTLPDHVWNRDASRGWGHLSLWAHYGTSHTGVCLRFDRARLITAFQEQTGSAALRFHGPVRYVSTQGVGPHGLDIGQIREFGVDAAALAYAKANHESLFFRKYRDWENEAEYRLVLLNQSLLPAHIDIRDALSGVVLGDAFPERQRPALWEVLKAYPDVEVQQLRFQNRYLHCFGPLAPEPAAKAAPWAEPRRSGSLEERLGAFLEATAEANELRESGKLLAADHLTIIDQAMAALSAELGSWPEVESTAHRHPEAVPVEQRSRQPGTPGERVHYQAGFMCVVENLPKPSHTLVAAAAVQVLDGPRLRLHGLVRTEHSDPDGNRRAEHWRAASEVSADEAASALSALLAGVRAAVNTVRPTFDEQRGQTPGEAG